MVNQRNYASCKSMVCCTFQERVTFVRFGSKATLILFQNLNFVGVLCFEVTGHMIN